jgi:methyl coenzyme M reductase gamma subunit
MDNTVEKPKVVPGRKKGTTNDKTYKWKVVIFDKDTHSFKEGKYTSVNHINQELKLNKPLNADYVRRIMTKYRADTSMRNKENSFLARYGHIHIEKINEPVKS